MKVCLQQHNTKSRPFIYSGAFFRHQGENILYWTSNAFGGLYTESVWLYSIKNEKAWLFMLVGHQ